MWKTAGVSGALAILPLREYIRDSNRSQRGGRTLNRAPSPSGPEAVLTVSVASAFRRKAA